MLDSMTHVVIGRAKLTAALLVLSAFASTPTAAKSDGRRSVGLTIASQQPLADLQQCVTRRMASMMNVTSAPIDGGVALDGQLGADLIAPAGRAIFSVQIVDRQTHRDLTAAYRRPLSATGATKLLQDAARHCDPSAAQ